MWKFGFAVMGSVTNGKKVKLVCDSILLFVKA